MNVEGVVAALVAALSWAISSILLKRITGQVDSLLINTLRLWVAAAVILLAIFSTGLIPVFLSAPTKEFLFVAASGVIAMAFGDTLYIRSLALLDASVAFPVAQCTFPLLTAALAVLLFDEPFSVWNGIGACTIVMGVGLIATAGGTSASAAGRVAWSGAGLLLALTAAIAWTIATLVLKSGSAAMDPLVAAAYRIPSAALALVFVCVWRYRSRLATIPRISFRTLAVAAIAGLLSYGVAAVGYVEALQRIGAARTVLLTTTSPLFVLLLARLTLGENPSARTRVGTLIAVIGVLLVMA